ncbi:uncharacterized protein KD926_004158 [Aspergillus affinis]|uniref:uncharacterized protein n=1 Tax=Aspergillus affinis TaxID=1070780 RepID=UPI0022FE659D|nr:uncharacterized protein KD926_004158 [Aspergillus affinis]KAI9046320.1 hypothetical protein KD926_004158 [Aspergillus affinis]
MSLAPLQYISCTQRLALSRLSGGKAFLSPRLTLNASRGLASAGAAITPQDTVLHPSLTVPHLVARDVSYASHRQHVQTVRDRLEQDGILKISLDFTDDNSHYLERLVVNLHERHGYGLPISHSASKGWFWDVRPSRSSFQTENHQARSETMENFPWHTDCSYEDCPPRFFALHVLHADHCGGGTLSVMNVHRLTQLLSDSTRDVLSRPEYRIHIPPEFIKSPEQRHIVGNVMATDSDSRWSPIIRYRGEIIEPLSDRAARALDELKELFGQPDDAHAESTVHLTPSDLPRNSIILLDNRRWLHARNTVKDPRRHLRRVRWDPVPFPHVAGRNV